MGVVDHPVGDKGAVDGGAEFLVIDPGAQLLVGAVHHHHQMVPSVGLDEGVGLEIKLRNRIGVLRIPIQIALEEEASVAGMGDGPAAALASGNDLGTLADHHAGIGGHMRLIFNPHGNTEIAVERIAGVPEVRAGLVVIGGGALERIANHAEHGICVGGHGLVQGAMRLERSDVDHVRSAGFIKENMRGQPVVVNHHFHVARAVGNTGGVHDVVGDLVLSLPMRRRGVTNLARDIGCGTALLSDGIHIGNGNGIPVAVIVVFEHVDVEGRVHEHGDAVLHGKRRERAAVDQFRRLGFGGDGGIADHAFHRARTEGRFRTAHGIAPRGPVSCAKRMGQFVPLASGIG